MIEKCLDLVKKKKQNHKEREKKMKLLRQIGRVKLKQVDADRVVTSHRVILTIKSHSRLTVNDYLWFPNTQDTFESIFLKWVGALFD